MRLTRICLSTAALIASATLVSPAIAGIAPYGLLNADGSNVLVGGSATCGNASRIDLYVVVIQGVFAIGDSPFTCTRNSAPFMIVLATRNGSLTTGSAFVCFEAYALPLRNRSTADSPVAGRSVGSGCRFIELSDKFVNG